MQAKTLQGHVPACISFFRPHDDGKLCLNCVTTLQSPLTSPSRSELTSRVVQNIKQNNTAPATCLDDKGIILDPSLTSIVSLPSFYLPRQLNNLANFNKNKMYHADLCSRIKTPYLIENFYRMSSGENIQRFQLGHSLTSISIS